MCWLAVFFKEIIDICLFFIEQNTVYLSKSYQLHGKMSKNFYVLSIDFSALTIAISVYNIFYYYFNKFICSSVMEERNYDRISFTSSATVLLKLLIKTGFSGGERRDQ